MICRSNGVLERLERERAVNKFSDLCLHVWTNTERLWKYLQTEKFVFLVGSPKYKAFVDMQSLDQRSTKITEHMMLE